MPLQTLTFTVSADRVGILTLNRPEARNAMTTTMMSELHDCFAGFYVDQDAAGCLVLTGAGRGFCAGADLKQRRGMTDDDWRRQHAIAEQMIKAVMDCPIPIIAAVNGAAFAGGLELALACDFIYAARSARFALTEVSLGNMPGAAVGLRDQRGKVAGFGQRRDELVWVGGGVVEPHPVGGGKTLAYAPDALADLRPTGVEGNGASLAVILLHGLA